MRTITLTVEVEVPEELAERWETLPAEERNQYAVAASPGVADVLISVMEEADSTDGELDPDLIEALQEGVADMHAGRILTQEQSIANFEATLAGIRARKSGEGD